MSAGPASVAELFDLLESNKLSEVEDIKKEFHEYFGQGTVIVAFFFALYMVKLLLIILIDSQ